MADKNPINWSGIGSAVSAGAGAIGSLFGLFTQNKANKDNMRFQRQENERNRNFQREMADYAYQKNLEQWNRENEYNSPIETLKRLKNAGLNPDLFYGGGAGNMVSADSPMMSAPSGTGGVSPAVRPISADTHALDLEMRRAQIDNIKSQTRQNDADANLSEIDALTRDVINNSKIEVNGVEVLFKKSQTELTKTQQKEVKANISNIQENTSLLKKTQDEINARIASLGEDVVYKRIQNYYASKQFEKQLELMCSEINRNNASARLSITEARDIVKTQVARLHILQNTGHKIAAETHNIKALGTTISLKNDILSIDSEYLPALYGSQIASMLTGSLVSVMDEINDWTAQRSDDSVGETLTDRTEYDKEGNPGRRTVTRQYRTDNKTGMKVRRIGRK